MTEFAFIAAFSINAEWNGSGLRSAPGQRILLQHHEAHSSLLSQSSSIGQGFCKKCQNRIHCLQFYIVPSVFHCKLTLTNSAPTDLRLKYIRHRMRALPSALHIIQFFPFLRPLSTIECTRCITLVTPSIAKCAHVKIGPELENDRPKLDSSQK